jgi:predicted NUDIX family NTP pyrophosphohydrolase
MYRRAGGQLQDLLAHPGGPFFRNKDEGAWSIPKGEIEPDEEPLAAAVREFEEEIGTTPTGPFHALTPIKQKGGKLVHAWAFEGDCDTSTLTSILTTTEWPPRSGRFIEIPEIDRASFFTLVDAHQVINVAQAELLDRLERVLALRDLSGTASTGG